MSHDYYLRCKRCHVQMEQGANHAEGALIEVAKMAAAIKSFDALGWDYGDLSFWPKKIRGIYGSEAQQAWNFAIEHAGCNAFIIVGEYPTDLEVRVEVKNMPPAPCGTCFGRGEVPCPECRGD